MALVATISNNGVVTVPFSQNQMGAFAAATINVGGAGQLTLSADTGSVALPISVTLCPTNPATAQCLAPPASSLQVSLGTGTTSTFSAFVTASGPVPPAFGLSRIFLRFTDADGVQHGSTSVAVETD